MSFIVSSIIDLSCLLYEENEGLNPFSHLQGCCYKMAVPVERVGRKKIVHMVILVILFTDGKKPS